MTNKKIIIADIGGTNARFAVADSDKHFVAEHAYKAADYPHLHEAIDAYIERQHLHDIDALVLAVAGPIIDQAVNFPNSHWQFSQAELLQKYQVNNVILLNDWEAIGYSLAVLDETDLKSIGGHWQPSRTGNISYSAIGPGSGLGVGGLKRVNGECIPLVTEGGHCGFAPVTPLQIKITDFIQAKVGSRVSAERLLSGPGIYAIYEALCHIHSQPLLRSSAAQVTDAAVAKTDLICEQALAIFFEVLGQTAGDIALVQGGFDGLFIGGGICQRFPELLADGAFRRGFENKGRHSALMARIPTWLITHDNPGLLGASSVANRMG